MELGVFLALIVFGAFGFIRRNSLLATGISVGVFFALGVFLSISEDIVLTKQVAAYNQTESGALVERNSTGGIVANTTTSNVIEYPNRTETTPIINSNHTSFAWLFIGIGVLASILFLRNVIGLAGWL